MGVPVFVKEEDDCVYRFEWATDVVCWDEKRQTTGGGGGGEVTPSPATELRCDYTDEVSGRTIDLSPLSSGEANYKTTVVDGDDTYVYHINVCRSLAESGDPNKPFIDECAPSNGVSGCQTKLGDPTFMKSLGKPASPTSGPDTDVFSLAYKGGTDCSAGKRAMRIDFVCDPTAGAGTPTFLSESKTDPTDAGANIGACMCVRPAPSSPPPPPPELFHVPLFPVSLSKMAPMVWHLMLAFGLALVWKLAFMQGCLFHACMEVPLKITLGKGGGVLNETESESQSFE
jgi:hypothetical protein